MHTRRLCTFLLGIWLGCSAFMAWVATTNLQVDAIMRSAGQRAQKEYQIAEIPRVQAILRHHAAELNRGYFLHWELAQLVLGAVLALMLLFSTNGNRLVMTLAVAPIAIVAVQHVTFTPQMIDVGRGIDFTTPDELFDERRALRGLHSYYMWLEAAKIVLLVGLTARLTFAFSSHRRRRRKSSDREVAPVVEEPDEEKIDR